MIHDEDGDRKGVWEETSCFKSGTKMGHLESQGWKKRMAHGHELRQQHEQSLDVKKEDNTAGGNCKA